MDREQQIARGVRAQQILDEPLVQEAIDLIESQCLQQWKDSPARDTEGRERIWMMVKMAQQFKRHFEAAVTDGKLAQHEVAELEKQSKMRKIFG